jgi:glycine/D-amino acid oxidase-like deaminating enzyme
MQSDIETADVLVIGGGMVGSAIAFGIAEKGARVVMLDEGDRAFRAARGNFGLVWYQGKGRGLPRYQQWCLEATRLWPDFAERLYRQTGFDVSYSKPGGLRFCFSEEDFEKRGVIIEQIRQETAPQPYDCQMLDRKTVQDMLPDAKVGDRVVGASYSPHDGHANPLALLRAMHEGFNRSGGKYYPGYPAFDINYTGGTYVAQTSYGSFSAPKLVIAAGNGTGRLASQVGMDIPVRPEKGQILVTERTRPLLNMPSNQVRQTAEGSFLLGFSEEEMVFDTRIKTDVIQAISSAAVNTFPILSNLRIVRCWAALRVMTPDKMPIYQVSESYPGAFAIALHSGVSLAAIHTTKVARWILEDVQPEGFENFTSRRFDV